MRKLLIPLMVLFLALGVWAQSKGDKRGKKIGKVSYLVGDATIESKRSKKLRVGSWVRSGQTIATKQGARVEIQYLNGNIIRIGEQSEISLLGTEQPKLNRGKVWSNIVKSKNGKVSYAVETPIATAAVRGTIFNVNYSPNDSSAEVALYEGVVEVKTWIQAIKGGQAPAWGEPQEVAGEPTQVTKEQWTKLLAGQEVFIKKDGSTRTEQMDQADKAKDTWVQFNKQRDSLVNRKAKKNDV